MSSGFSQIPHGFQDRLWELKGARLAIWLAHRCREGKKGESYPSLERLIKDTGYSRDSVIEARQWLRENGWLTSSGQKRGTRGQFSIPVEQTTIPTPPSRENHDTVSQSPSRKNHDSVRVGKSTTRPVGKTTTPSRRNFTDSVKSRPEVDPVNLEVDPKEKKREGEVIAPPQNQNLPSPASNIGSNPTPAQEKPSLEDDVNWVIVEAKRLTGGKAQFGKTAVHELRELLRELKSVNKAAIRTAIKAKAETLKPIEKDPTAWNIFGSQLVADLRPTLQQQAAADEAYQKAEDERAARDIATMRAEITKILGEPTLAEYYGDSVPLWQLDSKTKMYLSSIGTADVFHLRDDGECWTGSKAFGVETLGDLRGFLRTKKEPSEEIKTCL